MPEKLSAHEQPLKLFFLLLMIRIPTDDTLSYGSIKQNNKCIDTLGHGEGQTVGFYECHGQGGNQVCSLFTV